MLACFICRKRLGVYQDGELSRRKRTKVEQHLAECDSCREALTGLQKLAPLLLVHTAPPPPATLMSRIQAEATARQKRKSGTDLPRWWLGFWAGQSWALKSATTAALVVGLTVGGYMSWSCYREGSPAQSQAVMFMNKAGEEPLYAFQALDAAPEGSIVAATLALMENSGGGKICGTD